MGDEFLIRLNKSEPLVLETLGRELGLVECYVRERSSEGALAFRWRVKERRPGWPEDFTINHHGTELVLTVHSGNGREIEKILQDVQLALQRLGNTVIAIGEM